MTQAQFNVLDTLICNQIGRWDQTTLTVLAALAIGLAQSLSLTTSAQLSALATDVWG